MFATEPSTVAAPVAAPAKLRPSGSWRQIVDPVEPFLETVAARLSAQVREFDPSISAYADYALAAQGKQLRPALVALSANAVGRLEESHAKVAVIIEMVHLATLVHDDILDEAELRRGRRTLASNWGNEIAVLLGDCLFAQALKLAAGFPTTEVCRAVSAATNTVCTGEILQTRRRRDFKFTQAEYFKIIEMKTAELFALSCDLGAYLGGAPAGQRAGLRKFGAALGTAYQIYDDCLDLFGSETAAGKSLGTDLIKGKLTLPVLLLCERASEADRRAVQDWLQDWQPAELPQVVELLDRYRTREASLEIIEQFLNEARTALSVLSARNGRESLVGLTEFLAGQAASLGNGP
jgi:octaprenyl-diphosphate synthase